MKAFFRLFAIALLTLPAAAPASAQELEDEPVFSEAELDQMLAPIALYPDALLAQILMASTYPLEVVEAARWSRNNPGLEGEAAVAAVEHMDWDPSVKALVAFPQVLARMSEDLEWTKRLGDAVLVQEAQVMDQVQALRERAYAAGTLDSMAHIEVHREGEVIVVEPASPRVVYVPHYRPTVSYGGWWWPAYPPVYWAPPPVFHPAGPGYYWGSGVHVSLGFFFSTFDWHHRHMVTVDVHRHRHPHRIRLIPSKVPVKHVGIHRWHHEPKHRRGVTYRHEALERKHGRTRASLAGRPDVAPPLHWSGPRARSSQDRSGARTTEQRRFGGADRVRSAESRRRGDGEHNFSHTRPRDGAHADRARSLAERAQRYRERHEGIPGTDTRRSLADRSQRRMLQDDTERRSRAAAQSRRADEARYDAGRTTSRSIGTGQAQLRQLESRAGTGLEGRHAFTGGGALSGRPPSGPAPNRSSAPSSRIGTPRATASIGSPPAAPAAVESSRRSFSPPSPSGSDSGWNSSRRGTGAVDSGRGRHPQIGQGRSAFDGGGGRSQFSR
jgi:hypothetical protein